MILQRMMKKTRAFFFFLCVPSISLLLACVFLSNAAEHTIKKPIEHEEDFYDESSIWKSDPIEIDFVEIQILDKISGKVYRENIKKNTVKIFGSIRLELKRCFKNSPEDNKEVSAFVQITENGKIIFSNWLFASSPSINLFSHPVYDIRIEF